jgi:hypothetical protein
MTSENLTALLAQKIMNWTVGPDRFSMGDRRWMPRGRFRPTERIADAFRLLDQAAPEEYCIRGDDHGNCQVQIRIRGVKGEARGLSKPLTITQAIARAVDVEVGS